MNKSGRIIFIIVLAAVLLGAVCIGVGLMTGADVMRVYSTLDDRYNIAAYQQAYTQYAAQMMNAFSEVWNALFT